MSDLSKLIEKSSGFFKHLFGGSGFATFISSGEQLAKAIARQKVADEVEKTFAEIDTAEPDVEKKAEAFTDRLLTRLGPGAQALGHVLVGQAVAEAFVSLEKSGNFNVSSVERYINARLGL